MEAVIPFQRKYRQPVFVASAKNNFVNAKCPQWLEISSLCL